MKRWLLGIAAVLVLLAGGVALYLLTLDVDRFRDQILAQVQARTGRSASLGGPIELAISAHPTLTLSGLSVGGAPGGDGRPLLSARRVQGQVALLPLLRGELRVQRLLIEGADLYLEAAAAGDARPAGAAFGGVAAGAPLPSVIDARIDDSRIHYRDAAGAETTLRVDNLSLGRGEADALLSFAFEGQVGTIPVMASGSAGRLAQLLDASVPYPLQASVEALGVTAQLSGTVARPLRGEGIALAVELRAASLAALSRQLALELPAALPLALDASVRGDAAQLELRELSASLGENRVHGELDVALAGARPRISGTLHAERLNLLQLAGGAAALDDALRRARVFSAAAIELAGLRAVDAGIAISGDRVDTPLGEVNALAARLELDAGTLRIEPLRARIEGSAIDGTLSLSAPSADRIVLDLALDARKLDAAAVLARLGQDPFVRGLADLSLNVRGSGASAAAIAGSADGRVKLLMGSARARLAGLDRVVGGLTKMLGDLASGGSGEWTPVNCLAVDFTLANGIAEHKLLLFDTDAITLVGTGRIDLRDERLHLKLTPQPKSTTLNMSLPVDVGGTLLSPTYSPDKAAAARRAGGLLGGLLFPPAALAAFIDMGSGDDHPCAALARAGTAQPERAAPARPVKKKSGGLLDEVTDGIKSLFGN